MKYIQYAALFAFLASFSPALADTFTCTPAAFTLVQNGDVYDFSGTLQTPTPNYAYKITKAEDGGFVLKLTAPEGASVMMIGDLAISHAFTAEDVKDGLTLRTEKTFNWGEEAITCQKTS